MGSSWPRQSLTPHSRSSTSLRLDAVASINFIFFAISLFPVWTVIKTFGFAADGSKTYVPASYTPDKPAATAAAAIGGTPAVGAVAALAAEKNQHDVKSQQ